MANLSFLAGLLWGMHDLKKEEEAYELQNVDIDALIDYTAQAKMVQTPEKYITQEEKGKIIDDLKKSGVDSLAVETIESMIDAVLMKRFAIMYLVNALMKENKCKN